MRARHRNAARRVEAREVRAQNPVSAEDVGGHGPARAGDDETVGGFTESEGVLGGAEPDRQGQRQSEKGKDLRSGPTSKMVGAPVVGMSVRDHNKKGGQPW
jgi:hypothetical protein